MSDEKLMKTCLELAYLAKQNGKTAVGSVLVKDGSIISEGIEGDNFLPSPLYHAEIIAIVNALNILGTKDLSGCALYSTVEPCFMCSYLIRETKISKVVFGTEAGAIGGAISNYPILTASDIKNWPVNPEVISGVMEEECRNFLKSG